MSRTNWDVVTAHNCLLGESPVWDHRQKRIFWIDILNGEIHYFYPGRNEYDCYSVGRITGSIALKKSGNIIATIERSFATIDIHNKTMRVIAETEVHLHNNRFNDGKCDPAGRFWAGTMSVLNEAHAGSLYALEKDLTVSTKLAGVTCSNGLAWSPDHKTLYYIDTPNRNVTAFDYNITDGNLSDRRVVINIPGETGYPDGMTIDTEGMLWIAIWGGWKIIRYNPYTGKKLFQVTLPVSQVTSCIFGGDSMDDLYITSAGIGLSEKEFREQPLAGSLFVIRNSGFTGINSYEFGG
ncbi:MAG: SMP-30/gluconolactonase/LRE family protein [Bacteroidota bacterium]